VLPSVSKKSIKLMLVAVSNRLRMIVGERPACAGALARSWSNRRGPAPHLGRVAGPLCALAESALDGVVRRLNTQLGLQARESFADGVKA